ncbi:MAG TPA: hypothetical protein ENI08_01195 [Candidatus Dependentiae bacterium]|nr:hypothetical protein [Candidatus Dependentiae bacterium]
MYEKWQKKRVLFLFSIILISVGWFVTGQFLLERKEKKVSRVSATVLREQCVKKMGDIMQIIPAIMHGLADLESSLLTHIYAFFDGEKCFLLSAKKDQLSDLQQNLIACKQQLVAIKQTLQKQALFLQSPDSKKSKNNKSTKNNE